ncbi:MAG: hypothetical protein NDJ89_14585 [Oligoflexia bacterium]|nr:hypothetical protein [Oligoflexia bacterium]
MIVGSRFHRLGIALAAYRPEPGILAAQLDSIRQQDFSDWICVITCDSPLSAFINNPALASAREDARFKWLENPNRLGPRKNFERAIQEVLKLGVDAICCSDQDDIWYPNKLSASVRALEQAPPLSLVHCDMHALQDGQTSRETVWEMERRGVRNTQPHHLMVRNVVAGCAMMFDPELARRYPVIPEGVDYHDHWYALCAAFHGGVHPLPEPLYAYRQHEANQLGITPFQGILEDSGKDHSILSKCEDRYRWSCAVIKGAIAGGLPVTSAQRLLFLFRWDLGLLFLALGFRHLRSDPALSRACIARAVGKFFTLFGKPPSSPRS